MDLWGIFQFSYSWLKNTEARKLYALLVLVSFLTTIVVIAGAILIGGSAAATAFSTAADAGRNSPGLLPLFTGLGIAGIIFGILIIAAAALAQQYFDTKTMFSALRAKGQRTVEWTPRKFANYIILWIMNFVYAALSLLNRRFLPLVAAFYVLAALTIALFAMASPVLGILFMVLTGLVGVAYFFLYVYNAVRQSASLPIYLTREMRRTAALEQSWKLTEGKALEVFGISFLVGLAWVIVMLIIEALIMVVQFSGELLALAVPAAGIIFLLIAFALRLASSPISTFSGSYTMVGVYDWLLHGDKDGGNGSRKPSAAKAKPAAKKKSRK